MFASEWPNARWYVQESNALGWKTITAFWILLKFTPPIVMDKWKAMHHTDFWLHEMMVYHNSLSSCPYACPRCAIKQLNQVETDVMIQNKRLISRKSWPGGQEKGWMTPVNLSALSLSLSPHAVFEALSFLFMLNCIHSQTDRKLLLNFISAG